MANNLYQQMNQNQNQSFQNNQSMNEMIKLVANNSNPNQALQMLAQQNPKVAQVMQMVNMSGMSPKQLFMQMARQSGMDPSQILRNLK